MYVICIYFYYFQLIIRYHITTVQSLSLDNTQLHMYILSYYVYYTHI